MVLTTGEKFQGGNSHNKNYWPEQQKLTLTKTIDRGNCLIRVNWASIATHSAAVVWGERDGRKVRTGFSPDRLDLSSHHKS